MVPQLDNSYYFSQIVWLIICLTILVIFFKKIFLPKMSSIIETRDKKICELKNEINQLSQKYDSLTNEIEKINNKRVAEIKKIIESTKEKCNNALNEQMLKIQDDSNDTIKKIRNDAEKILSNLEQNTITQVDEISQQLFAKLFKTENKK